MPNGYRRLGEADKILGERIRMRRLELRISQDCLADALGLSFQQIQKYEKGINRVTAPRLKEIAKVLCTSVSQLLDLGDETKPERSLVEMLSTSQGVRLAAAYVKLDDAKQSAVVRVAEAMIEVAASEA